MPDFCFIATITERAIIAGEADVKGVYCLSGKKMLKQVQHDGLYSEFTRLYAEPSKLLASECVSPVCVAFPQKRPPCAQHPPEANKVRLVCF